MVAGGDVAVPVALHRPHHQGFVGDLPQEAIRGIRGVAGSGDDVRARA